MAFLGPTQAEPQSRSRGSRQVGTKIFSSLFHRRFLNRRWKRRRIEITSCSIGPDGSGSKSKVILVDVILTTRVFLKFFIRFSEHPRSRILEWLGIELRIFNQRFDMDVIGVGPGPAFHNMERVAVRICVFIDPHFFILEADGIDHQGVSLPMTNLLPEEGWVGIVGMLAIRIDRNQTKIAIPVKKCDFLCSLQNFKGQTAGVVAWNATNDAKTLGINSRRQIMLQRRLSSRRQRKLQSRKVLADVADRYRVTRTLPIPAQVWMTVGRSRSGFGLSGLHIDCG